MRIFWGILVLVACAAGFWFSTVSTYDTVAHLDRQVHGIHCTYTLGMGQADMSGTSGCYATMMSTYSSVLRSKIWGGIPVALPSMSVFAFLFFWTAWMLLRGRVRDTGASGFLVAGTLLPVIVSAYMGYVAFVELEASCKLCIGIYGSSALAFLAALIMRIAAGRRIPSEEDARERSLSFGFLVAAFGLGVAFVAVPVGAYAALAPDMSHYVANCGHLRDPVDPKNVMVPVGPQESGTEMIEVMDPLCGACAFLEHRFGTMPESNRVSRKLLLFPMDDQCNWMIGESIHPGACTVSEAILCAEDKAEEVIAWAMANQASILEESEADPEEAKRMILARFPDVGSCLGSPKVQARLNLSLRWAMNNRLQILTPQIYVGGLRLCDEDTDLGLEYALPRLISRIESGYKPPKTDLPIAPRPARLEPTPEQPSRDSEAAPTEPDTDTATPDTEEAPAIGEEEQPKAADVPATPTAPIETEEAAEEDTPAEPSGQPAEGLKTPETKPNEEEPLPQEETP